MSVFKTDQEHTIYIHDRWFKQQYVDPNTSKDDAVGELAKVKQYIIQEEHRERMVWVDYKFLEYQQKLLEDYIRNKSD